MPIKRYTKGTGHTKKPWIEFSNLTPEEFENEVRPMFEGNSFDERLAAYEEISCGVLMEGGFTVDVKSAEFDQIRRNVEFQSDEWFACEVLAIIDIIRAARARADKSEEPHLLLLVLDLGHRIAEWKIKATMRATSQRSHPRTETASKQEERRQAFERSRARGLSVMRAYEDAAVECGVDIRTIRRALEAKK